MKENLQYYDLNPMLSKKDINGKEPVKRIITGNRGGGKSHAMEEHILSSLRKHRYRKIAILCRYKGELEGIAERFFSVSDWMHEGMNYRTGKIYKMGYCDIYLNDIHVGYGIAVSASDNIKDASGIFKQVDCAVWNEFQREDDKYLPKEARQLNSIISSVSRGEGKQGRYVPFFFLSNFISLLSPLLADLEIEKRLKSNTKYVRGEGFVFEQLINLQALIEQSKITGERLDERTVNNIRYLNDNRSAIYRPSGRFNYCETFKVGGKSYGLIYYPGVKIYHVTKNVDKLFKLVYSKDKADISLSVFVPKHQIYYREAFEKGRFSFADLECKSALIKYISYGCN